RYRDQVSPTKRSAHTEKARINAMVRRPIAHRTLAKLTSSDVAFIAMSVSKTLLLRRSSASSSRADFEFLALAVPRGDKVQDALVSPAATGRQTARSTRVLIALRSIPKSIGLVKSASAPLSSALRLVSASP